jgi:hypothetical protein
MEKGVNKAIRDLEEICAFGHRSGRVTASTLKTVLRAMRGSFLPWLTERHSAKRKIWSLSSIDRDLLEAYAENLANKHSPASAYNLYSHLLIIMRLGHELNLCASPYEMGMQRRMSYCRNGTKSTKPYSKYELSQISIVLHKYLIQIRSDPNVVPQQVALAVYFSLMALRTGFNASSLLLLSRDALREHPLRPGYSLLVSYKTRARKEVQFVSKWLDSVDKTAICDSSVESLYRELLDYTHELTQGCSDGGGRAFVRGPLRRTEGTSPIPLTLDDVSGAIRGWLGRRHVFTDEQGQRFWPSPRRFRATLASRAFELAGGDPLVVAKILGNAGPTVAAHYVAAPKEAVVEFHRAMVELRQRLEGAVASFSPTPVSGCSDPLEGRYAPKNGVTYCERWTSCFKCPNQVITGEANELWRLYSFYWALQSKSQFLRRTPAWPLVRFAIKAMQTAVVERFGERASIAMERARRNPHPFWAKAKIEGWQDVREQQ